MSAARFEVVRTAAGWHARFRAANGRIVWWTETYTTRRRCLNAVGLIAKPLDAVVTSVGVRCIAFHSHTPVEVRDVDEREAT